MFYHSTSEAEKERPNLLWQAAQNKMVIEGGEQGLAREVWEACQPERTHQSIETKTFV